MNNETKQHLQRLLDLYVLAAGLDGLIVDRDGEVRLESWKRIEEVGQSAPASAGRWIGRMRDAVAELHGVREPVFYEHEAGLTSVVAPVVYNGTTLAYVCAGVLSGEASKRSVLGRLAELAAVAAALLAAETSRAAAAARLHGLQAVGAAGGSRADRVRFTLRQLQADLALDTVGLAERELFDRFTVTEAVGDEAQAELLLGESVTLGEGFIGFAAVTGQAEFWTRREGTRPRSFFPELNFPAEALVCLPLMLGGELTGMLFGLKRTPASWSEEDKSYAKLLAEAAGRNLHAAGCREALDRHAVRNTVLLELCHTVTRLREVKPVLRLLVDVCHNLQLGSFVGLVMKPGPDGLLFTVSRNMTAEQMDRHARDVAARCFGETSLRVYGIKQPVLLPPGDSGSADWLCELPLQSGSETYGLLTVALRSPQALDEYRAFLCAVAIIGETRIGQLEQQQRLTVQARADLLFAALAYWNPDAWQASTRAQELAEAFGRDAGWSEANLRLLTAACAVSAYDADYLEDALQDAEIAAIVRGAERLRDPGASSGETAEARASGAGLLAGALLLLTRHVERLEQPPTGVDSVPAGVDPALHAAFQAFACSRITAEYAVPLDAAAKPPLQAPRQAEPKPPTGEAVYGSLTPREREVLSLIFRGLSNQEIAEKLFISSHTVKNHLTKIYEKLGVADRTQALALLYRPDWEQGAS